MEEDIIRNSSWKGRKFNFDLIIKKKKNLFPYIHITHIINNLHQNFHVKIKIIYSRSRRN